MVPTFGSVPGLTPVKAAIFPVPLAPNPIDVLLFVQLNTVPAIAPVNVTGAVNAPGHIDWFGTAFTVGVGLTVIVNETGVPVQVVPPLVYAGVTVKVPVIGTKVALVEVKEISPVPLAPRPILVLVLVQL